MKNPLLRNTHKDHIFYIVSKFHKKNVLMKSFPFVASFVVGFPKGALERISFTFSK